MQVSREIIDDLNSIIALTVSPSDYETEVTKRIKKQQTQITMPGFRKGHVPFGVVKKMYGDAFRGEEINKVISQNLFDFIEAEKLDILGNPVPIEDTENESFKEGDDLNLKFKIGLAPKFDIKLDENLPFENYNILVDDNTLEETIENIRKQNSVKTNVESINDNTIVETYFEQVDNEGNPIENGIKTMVDFTLSEITSDDFKNILKENPIGNKIQSADIEYFKNKEMLSEITKTDLENYDTLPLFNIEIKEWFERVPAELDEKLFQRVFPTKDLKDLDEFKTHIRESLSDEYKKIAENFFIIKMKDNLLEKINFELPTEFLKEWLLTTNEKLTAEELDKDFIHYINEIKWQLIEKEISKHAEIKISNQDILDGVAASYFGPNWKASNNEDMTQNIYKFISENVQKNPEVADRVGRQLVTEKVAQYLLDKATIITNDVTAKDFQQIEKEYFENKKNI